MGGLVRRFRPPLWAVALTVPGLALLLCLGFWQLQRAQEKEAMISAYLQAAKAPPADLGAWLAAGHDPAALYGRSVRVRGRLEPGRSLLLDNQVSRRQPGYHVWTPLAIAGGRIRLVVDRGWIAMDPDRRRLPEVAAPAGERVLHGVWQPLPRPGLRLGADDCDRSRWPRVVQYPLAGELRCLLGDGVADGLLWLDPDEPQGYRREWLQGGLPPARHYGYAVQWFALALTLLVLFVVINLRKDSR